MHPVRHVFLSTIVAGILWGLTASLAAAVAALLSGVFIDLDHLFPDYLAYVLRRRRKPGIVDFYKTCHLALFEKATLCLHSYEILLGLWIVYFFYARNMVLLGISVGFSQHLVADQVTNRIRWWGYSLIGRALAGFRLSAIRRPEDPSS